MKNKGEKRQEWGEEWSESRNVNQDTICSDDRGGRCQRKKYRRRKDNKCERERRNSRKMKGKRVIVVVRGNLEKRRE
jgi:hypothetical protein